MGLMGSFISMRNSTNEIYTELTELTYQQVIIISGVNFSEQPLSIYF